jgi:hypothetical protein
MMAVSGGESAAVPELGVPAPAPVSEATEVPLPAPSGSQGPAPPAVPRGLGGWAAGEGALQLKPGEQEEEEARLIDMSPRTKLKAGRRGRPRKGEEMTEAERKARRREINRIAARRSHQKKVDHLARLEKVCSSSS